MDSTPDGTKPDNNLAKPGRAGPESFADIVNLWPSAEALAAEIGEKGVTVRAMRNRDSIDSGYWERILAAASARGFHSVTAELLIRLAARKKQGAAA